MSSTDPSAFTQEFATEYARNAVPNMLKAIASIKRYNRFVLLGALATSYLHQAHYLWTQKAGYFAYLVPLIFDAAMVSMLTVVRTAGIARDAKRGALVVFAACGLLSATINFASPGGLGLRLVFALVVVLVIGVELVAGRIRPDFAAIEAEAAALLTAARDLAAKNTDTTSGDTATGDTASADAPAPTPVVDNPPAPDPVPAIAPAPEPAPVPLHLLPMARFAAVQHEQTTGQPITPAELADRLDVATDTAGHLLASITTPTLNGHHHNGSGR
ncbi:DUF2637 domain-containing protein [Micromonospora globbae]|uniref:DUF2637 domain-containing protein n=1 Tax=Micromonospora globbae TaxID=1894969 RepID=A0A420EYT6_9ACTN|nr:DUF2637 domain-containing protein [Micromonospora globbae]RKF25915.1 DUF2637 domain-containing protein [Micromonospora globbae]